MTKKLSYAGWAGIVTFISGVAVAIIEFPSTMNEALGAGMQPFSPTMAPVYWSLLIISFVSYLIYAWGYKELSEKYNNPPLRISVYIYIVLAVLYYAYTSYLRLTGAVLSTPVHLIVSFAILLGMGVGAILAGKGLRQLQGELGPLAKTTGTLSIITGISFLTILLSFVGILLSLPLYLMSIMLLFRAAKKVSPS